MPSKTAEVILKERYYHPGENWDGLCNRVASEVAKGTSGYTYTREFFDAIKYCDFLPNSPTLMNAGTDMGLSACYIIDVEDNLESIYDSVKKAALITKSGGGFGLNFSNIRAKGSRISTTEGVSSGPVSFMHSFNAMIDSVKQGGRRRGAMMACLDVDHPDIKEFITAKRDNKDALKNMNISVMVTDKFMNGVMNGNKDAVELWNLIIESATETAEPGIMYADTISKDNIHKFQKIRSSNPCAEFVAIPWASCNLASVNMSNCVINQSFVIDNFRQIVNLACRFTDSAIDINNFPIKEIEEVSKAMRPLGVGVMGFADCLIKMGIRYGSEECLEFIDYVGSNYEEETIMVSEEMGVKYGTFPAINDTILEGTTRRNAQLRSIAPTGTIATIAGVSFGIEPLFAVAYERHILDRIFIDLHPIFEEMIIAEGLDIDIIKKLVVGKPSIQNIEEIPKHIRELFVTAHDLTPKEHIAVQARWQKYVDASISKTVNAPADYTEEQVAELYKYAWEMGCKGVTVYRAGSREAPIKLEGDESNETKNTPNDCEYFAPDITHGPTIRIPTACGNYHCTVSGIDEDVPIKVMINATTGGCDANLDAIGRLASLALRCGIDPQKVIKQLTKVECAACIKSGRTNIKSCADGIGKSIRYYIQNENIRVPKKQVKDIVEDEQETCDSCGEMYTKNAKCGVCPHCGFSRCG